MPKLQITPVSTVQDGWADDGDDTNGPRVPFATPKTDAVDQDTWAVARTNNAGQKLQITASGSAVAGVNAKRVAAVTSRVKIIATLDVHAALLGFLPWRRVKYDIEFVSGVSLREGRTEVLGVAWLFDAARHQRLAFQRSYRFELDPADPNMMVITPGPRRLLNFSAVVDRISGRLWLRAGRYRIELEVASLPVAEKAANMVSTLTLALD